MTWLDPIVRTLGDQLLAQIPWALGLALLFTVISQFPSQACNPGKHWWRNPGLLTDTHYLFIIPVIMPYLRTIIVVFIVALLQSAINQETVLDFIHNGRGPLS